MSATAGIPAAYLLASHGWGCETEKLQCVLHTPGVKVPYRQLDCVALDAVVQQLRRSTVSKSKLTANQLRNLHQRPPTKNSYDYASSDPKK